jgi:RND family efflux transporter MFP subunit
MAAPKKNIIFFAVILILCILLLPSCTPTQSEATGAIDQGAPSPVLVTTSAAARKTFYHELICNGTVEAENIALVGFEVPGIINDIPVQNGQWVSKGDLLARLDSRSQELALEGARNGIIRARIELEDFLLGYSSRYDSTSLPPQVMETARIRSGLAEAELRVKELELQLEKTQITAPISGRLIDLLARPHNPTASYEYLCRVVDEGSLQVVFGVLESELHMVEPGTRVEISPFAAAEKMVPGRIKHINRMVDKDGMVQVTARLEQNTNSILPGMKVRVLVQKSLPNQLVIPAEALTSRQNRDVVFVRRDSLAYWQYVTAGARNTREVVILEGLEEGDMVIVAGNATIGHEAWVSEE